MNSFGFAIDDIISSILKPVKFMTVTQLNSDIIFNYLVFK